ncbi:hypothetical protein ACL02T_01320 [Pseudonocardia sp. RS010]|uniref:hypothetical protein n=1 Tax=Pseudonocardia sp. RS010 TaxID=3385979 RepID=UPI00399F2890
MHHPRSTVDDDEPPGAADALALIRAQQAGTAARLGPRSGTFLLVWGAAWVLTGALSFASAVGGLPAAAAGWGTLGVVAVGLAASTVVGLRSGRGVSGPSTRRTLLYALTWPAVMVGLVLLVVGLATSADLPPDVLGLLVPALFALTVGALYAVSGAIWTSLPQFLLGLWVVAVGVASTFAGVPANALVLGIGVGGALLLLGVRQTVRAPRSGGS